MLSMKILVFALLSSAGFAAASDNSLRGLTGGGCPLGQIEHHPGHCIPDPNYVKKTNPCPAGYVEHHPGHCVKDTTPVKVTNPCGHGKKLVSGYCVLDVCHYDFTCPRGSSRKPGRDCYNNFDDCECDHGYVKGHGTTCVATNPCGHGRKLVSDYCVADWCHYDFSCPHKSYRLEHRDCYNNSYDCACQYGYFMEHGQCKPYWWCYW